MSYLERPATDGAARLIIDGGPYDIDYAGLDDGADPRQVPAFRIVLQLGQGLMIYLYVVGFEQPGDPTFFHTFWTKDCAVAWVEMEEHGPPAAVSCEPFALPALYRTAAVGEERWPIGAVTFLARVDGSETRLELRWELGGDDGGELRWSSGRWELVRGGIASELAAGTRVTFADA